MWSSLTPATSVVPTVTPVVSGCNCRLVTGASLCGVDVVVDAGQTMRETISREHPWEVMPDLLFYRDPEEEEQQRAAGEAG
ncbi:hypothetical protein SKAU_G00294760 [Synaphobranchus kaupii]|uniref:Uncharacterized protein n=1 Tax=Synaphobranchus kaupii TaxID=118154 RepID=A0A9Q1IMN0_SYNKA|nr:hypothetical protein SKAU_G00294760 [Synaphobranchus kaupii]